MLFPKQDEKLSQFVSLKTTTNGVGRWDNSFSCLSRAFYQESLKSYQRIGPLKKQVLDGLVGNLLGDGFAERRGNSTRIVLKLGSKKQNYIHYLHKIMSDGGVCSENLPKTKVALSKGGKVYYNVKFATYSFSQFNHLYESFYHQRDSEGKLYKGVPDNIGELLTPRGLAHWIMDDGSLYRHGGRVGGIRISAESFCFQEMPKLLSALSNNFSVSCTVHKHKMESGSIKPMLYIPKQGVQRLEGPLSAYFEPTMLYKILV